MGAPTTAAPRPVHRLKHFKVEMSILYGLLPCPELIGRGYGYERGHHDRSDRATDGLQSFEKKPLSV